MPIKVHKASEFLQTPEDIAATKASFTGQFLLPALRTAKVKAA